MTRRIDAAMKRWRARTWTERVVIAGTIIAMSAGAAWAAMAVTDAGTHAKLSSVISLLKEISANTGENALDQKKLTDSFGPKGKISLNLGGNLSAQRRRWLGMAPDGNAFTEAMRLPKELKFGDVTFSTSEISLDVYDRALRFKLPPLSKDAQKAKKTLRAVSDVQLDDIRFRRQATLENAAVDGIAASDTAADNYARHLDDITALQQLLNPGSQTAQERFAVLGGLLVKLNTLMAENNLLLSKQMKITGADGLRGLPLWLQAGKYRQEMGGG